MASSEQPMDESIGLVDGLWGIIEKHPEALNLPKHADEKQVDASLAEDLNKLSLQERETAYEELHGVAPEIEETSELIIDQLAALETEIQKIAEKPAYDLAFELDPSYVESRKFRIMFLRAERFDPNLAALRLIMFFEKKRKFFGDDSLVRPLSQKDLTADDMATMKSGANQLLTARDRSGRLVIVDLSACGPQLYTDILSHMRVHIYLVLSALEDDEETQKRGVVTVCWYYGGLRFNEKRDEDATSEALQTLKWLPFRMVATHICTEATPLKSLLTSVLVAIGPRNTRHSLRCHRGTTTEVKYMLMTFGIPIDLLPVTSDGKVKTANQKKFIARQQVKEQELQQFGTFDRFFLPTPRDVLLGRGKPFQQHQGNVRLREVIQSMLGEYASSPNKQKAAMTWKIVYQLKATGKFLKKDSDDWWVEATDQEARDKVGKSFVFQSSFGQTPSQTKTIRKEQTEPAAKRPKPEPAFSSTVEQNCLGYCMGDTDTDALLWGRQFIPAPFPLENDF